MLAKVIRKNKNIHSICVKNKEIRLSQYADDTMLILDGTRESPLASLQLLDGFYVASGLRLNDKKTEALFFFWKINEFECLILRHLPFRKFVQTKQFFFCINKIQLCLKEVKTSKRRHHA